MLKFRWLIYSLLVLVVGMSGCNKEADQPQPTPQVEQKFETLPRPQEPFKQLTQAEVDAFIKNAGGKMEAVGMYRTSEVVKKADGSVVHNSYTTTLQLYRAGNGSAILFFSNPYTYGWYVQAISTGFNTASFWGSVLGRVEGNETIIGVWGEFSGSTIRYTWNDPGTNTWASCYGRLETYYR